VLLLLRAPGFYLDMFMGILIVVAVIFNKLIPIAHGANYGNYTTSTCQ